MTRSNRPQPNSVCVLCVVEGGGEGKRESLPLLWLPFSNLLMYFIFCKMYLFSVSSLLVISTLAKSLKDQISALLSWT